MRVGYIVSVADGSWSLGFMGQGGLVSPGGCSLNGRRWVVVAVGGPLPTKPNRANEINDVMLSEVGAPEHILFTQCRFCNVIKAAPGDIRVTANGKTVYISRQSAEALGIG